MYKKYRVEVWMKRNNLLGEDTEWHHIYRYYNKDRAQSVMYSFLRDDNVTRVVYTCTEIEPK